MDIGKSRVDTADFACIVLSSGEWRALKKLAAQDAPDIELCRKYPALFQLGFIARKAYAEADAGKPHIGHPPYNGAPYVTDRGRLYLSNRRSANSERRWTRGLAIAALLISLCALLLEFQDRGWFDWLTPGKTPAGQSMLIQSESQESTQ